MIFYFQKGAIDQYQEKKSTKNEHPKRRLSSYVVTSKKDQKDDQQRKELVELHPTGMHDYMKRKTNEDHDNIQPRKSETDTVKCVSVNGKLDAEVIIMCIIAVWVGHKSSRKMVKTYAM